MKLLRKLRALFRKEKLDAEMSEEMRTHLEFQIEENVARGMSAEEARYAALRSFGGVEQIKERARDQRGWTWVDHLDRDVRHGWRMLRKAPFVSIVIVLSLGLGVGVNAVVFSWIQSFVFRPLPGVEDATRFQLIEAKTETHSHPGWSWLEYRDLRERLTAFQDVIAFRTVPINYGERGQEERVHAQLVSANYFSGLGLRPAAGHFPLEDEAKPPGGAAVAVISHEFWRARFGASPEAIGRTLRLNDRLVTVVGVAPEGFQGTVVALNFDLWLPATLAPVVLNGSRELETRDARGYSAMGRLRSGATFAQAQAELRAATGEFAQAYPTSNRDLRGEVLPFWKAPRGAARFFGPSLLVMQGLMLLVLFVVCANAANLLFARANARRREIGVRLALGARPRQIVRMLLVESVLLGAAGASLGLVLAVWGVNALRAVPMPGALPVKFNTELDFAGVLFTAALGFGCALIFGLAPALRSARTDSQLALRSAAQSAGSGRLRSLLVSAEVALALLVLIVATLFLRNFLETRHADTGFNADGVLLTAYDITNSNYDSAAGLAAMDELLGQLRAAPGVEAAAIASWVPLDFHGMPGGGFRIEGRARSDGGQDRALMYAVTPGYFELMEIPLVAGRDFVSLKDAAAAPEVIVNDEFVRRYLPEGFTVGRRVIGPRLTYQIVGVTRNALYESFGEPPKPMMYFSYRERFFPTGQIHVRVGGVESAFASTLQRIARGVDAGIGLYDVRSLNEHVDKNLFFRRIPARMFAVLGPVILGLAAIGIYAVVAYAVAQRTTEIGIRLALGATQGGVVRQIVRESLRGVLLGVAPAWLLAVVVMLHIRGGALNFPSLIGVPVVLIAVAAAASWLPARRAAKVDPMVALRTE